uniref:Cornifelin homolog A-like n=1 Tax=Stegastes partitus TaxID=144197 RepID=A0A3B5A4I3_9TELE
MQRTADSHVSGCSANQRHPEIMQKIKSKNSKFSSSEVLLLCLLSGCLAFWCFPCFTCVTSHKAGECVCLPLLDGFGLIPPITTSMRVSVRQRYGIEGTICKDCCYTWCCYSCTWCQIAREIKTRANPILFVNMNPK